ncbi:response regulator transcription factor [Alteromonas sp. ASW11-19]|uniref:Response regulator transcription factor n=1 Tax=Alteromonas salexigens TaxID=2982530 RepID=A0ABT2VJ97_9ALTE|nr:response regulator transcription factor [Alteromonas salexigens]MCU7553297.1 response regulator transcription factor [Alteromonas salexigens]
MHSSNDQAILIIDDDHELSQMLQAYLQGMGYTVSVAQDGKAGLQAATTEHFDLILLDVMMPEMDGFDVLKHLRVTHTTPVLMLTARGDDYDRILGLELGADDYLPKPFNHRELAARIKAIFRRLALTQHTQTQQDLQVNGILLSSARQQVEVNGTPLTLTGTEFAILQLMMTQPGQLVSKQEISQRALGKKLMAFDRSIDMHVSNLRKKMAAVASDDKIKTIRGSGYLLRTAS